ncbi:sigma-70 family RNA polymerase sigma factor [Bacillus sp. 2205SS5-2]|uniref:sigma-70 family RNA polymerase sigma factor n=1 Tax=Bacillus sp. 2205SS5-2 TaxID=3109031 RepID=UPI003003F3B6
MNQLELVKKSITGDEKAFEILVKNESEKLYKTAFLYVRNKEDALDVLQETIYKAFISIAQLKYPEFFSTWLTKILIRTAIDMLEKQKKLVCDEKVMQHAPAAKAPDIDSKVDLIRAISTLSQDYQTVIILFYYHDYPIRLIAEAVNKPENTVKTYLRRAKLQLKDLLEGANNSEKSLFS